MKIHKELSFKVLIIILALLFCMTTNNCCVSSDANAISKELKTIEKDIPLPYHRDLIKTVEKYEKLPLPETFLMHETFIEMELMSRGIPLELKYLPISLSGMQIDYQDKSRCGVWALSTLVGLHYGLIIDEQHDERYSIERSTKAALNYLVDLHDKYNDWWYAILAFSSSPNSLQHALSKCEEMPKLWDFYDQNLIPKSDLICNFISCIVVYHDHVDENAEPQKSKNISIDFSHPISLTLLSNEIGLSVNKIKALNPVYRTEVLVPLENHPLILPNNYEKYFPTIAQRLYDGTMVDEPKVEETKPIIKEEPVLKKETPKKSEKIVKYKVKKGDTLSRIAQKYRVTISELVEWNHLENDLIRDGQELIIKK